MRDSRLAIIVLGAFALVSVAGVSAHFVKGLGPSGSTSAFVSSPTETNDAPIPVKWGPCLPATPASGSLLLCRKHFAALLRSSRLAARHRGWFELPGSVSGFALVRPARRGLAAVEGVRTSLAGHGKVTLDFAIVADVNPNRRTPGRPHDPAGIRPANRAACVASGRGSV